MIVIKSVEYIETEKDIYEIDSTENPLSVIPVTADGGIEYEEAAAVVEMLKGRRFRRPSDGIDIVVAPSVQSQEVLGLMYEAWDNMAEELHDAQSANIYHRNQLRGKETELKNRTGTFWKRLKHLFKSS